MMCRRKSDKLTVQKNNTSEDTLRVVYDQYNDLSTSEKSEVFF